MASPPSLKTLNSINLFSIKPPSPSLSSMKLKTLLQTFFFSHIYRALSKAKSLLLQIFKLMRKRKHKKLYFASFRLHYNWCSSSRSLCYPASLRYDVDCSGELSKYLQWLDERGDEESCNEIDRLADLFIADCHEKFRLEKQESYRRFQEMMARSV
ncbi:hypothetical protein SASPL_126798 [Salvia splendens]|uniref:Uncharacterized protein n=1 Tax=Salvia splendens TaxID=180675 RepID=A0A8X8XHM7_SALSN|nr:uncharacterized protein LOC121749324 [Salvia splendens]KAG6414081.1 hypothetical protein SASPL_126798 [Salvia splendens]